VNTRPVRLPPCAAGAKPTITTRGRTDPHPGIGRPQYGWSANDLRFTTATSSRHSTSRGHARHTDTSASSSSTVLTAAAIDATWAGVSATAVRDVAGSPGQPEPAATGESNITPVRGWASFTRPLCMRGKNACRATPAAVRFGRDTP
jgi:hypothetical protein